MVCVKINLLLLTFSFCDMIMLEHFVCLLIYTHAYIYAYINLFVDTLLVNFINLVDEKCFVLMMSLYFPILLLDQGTAKNNQFVCHYAKHE
jgi:hypothetical protein